MLLRRVCPPIVLALALLVAAPVAARQAATLPASLSNAEFWALINELSEPDGFFRSDNLVSNEIYFQTIIPELVAATRPDRVYLGVGPEQNFTYIAALKPRMVFIIDVRRGNLHTHLLYKALFEMAKDRGDFVSLLFSKKRPDGLTATTTARDLFAAYMPVETSEAIYMANLKAIQDHLTKTRALPLRDEDLRGIEYVYHHFYWYGPSLTYSSSTGGGGRGGNFVNYQSLMTTDDGVGVARSYLATEENFLALKALHSRNLFVPIVGNFGGSKAIRGVGQWLAARKAMVSAFYLSNVEQYLSQDGLWYTFCGNFARLPIDETSLFIYSQSGGGGGGRGSLLSYYRPILADVKANKCDTGLVPARRH